MRLLSLALLGVWLMAACSSEQARHTVEEYRADAMLRHTQVERCRRDPGTLRNTPDCINAETAASFEDRVRLRNAPPVGIGQEKAKPTDERRGE